MLMEADLPDDVDALRALVREQAREIDAMKAVAKSYPKSDFAIVDVANADEGGLKNVEGLLFKEQEVGYLAGYAAALAAKEAGKNTVSSVGGQKQPPVDRYIAGFQAGAQAAVPGIKTLNGYSQDFTDQAKWSSVSTNRSRTTDGSMPASMAACLAAGYALTIKALSSSNASAPSKPLNEDVRHPVCPEMDSEGSPAP